MCDERGMGSHEKKRQGLGGDVCGVCDVLAGVRSCAMLKMR